MATFYKFTIQYNAFNFRGEPIVHGLREEIAHSEAYAIQVVKAFVNHWKRNADRIETRVLSQTQSSK